MKHPRLKLGVAAACLLAAPLFGATVALAPAQPLASEPLPASSATPRLQLDLNDELATLEAIQTALSQVEDRATYIWQTVNGRISGAIELTSSFRDRRGWVCRHLIVSLAAGDHSGRREGVACRDTKGLWQLDG